MRRMPALSLVKTLVVLASLALVGLGSAGGQGPKGKSPLDTKVPESIEDLRALEKAVQAILPKVQASTVAIYIGTGQGSGVIISEDGYVLTAGHVSGKPGQTAWVIMPDGKKLKATTLGRNTGIDSGLVKITDEGKYPFLDMGKAASLKKGQWVVAVGHPGGFRLNRKPVVRLGRVIQHNHLAIQTDCTLVGGDSGGPLFDLDGKIIGIHSRIGTQITENVHVPVDTYKETWDRLAKAEEWGGVPGRHVPVQSLGGKVVFEVDGTDPKAPDKKGVLTSDDPKDKKLTESHHKVFNVKMSPGHAYTIDLVSKDVDSHVRLEDAKGKEIDEDDDSAGDLNSRVIFRPDREETYRVIATTHQPGQVGQFKLTIRQVPLTDQIAGKVSVYPALRVPTQLVRSLMDKWGKQEILHATVTLWDAKGKPAGGKTITFQWQGGQKVTRTDDKGGVRFGLIQSNSHDLTMELPEGCKAFFLMTDPIGFPIDFGGQEKVAAAEGKIVYKAEGKLTGNDAKDKVRAGCASKVYADVKLTGGVSYTFDLLSNDFDAFIRIENSAGRQVAEDDDSGGHFNSRLIFRPQQGDTFRVIVTTCDPGQTGGYALFVRETTKK